MDLLAVLTHEIGHVLGLSHDDRGIMNGTLAAGVRLAPALRDGSSAVLDQLFAAEAFLGRGRRGRTAY